jgi:hypothetical protein
MLGSKENRRKAVNEREFKMESENTAHMAIHAMIAGLVFCVAVAGVFHFAPVHDMPAAMAAVQPAAPVAQPAPAECLPSGTGGECIPFDQLIQQMQNTPEVIPANPAAKNLERI